MPVRKRTVLVDQRISRSRLSAEADPRELLEQQHAMQNPPRMMSPPSGSTAMPKAPRAVSPATLVPSTQDAVRAVSPSTTMSRMQSASTLGLGMALRREPEVQRETIEESVKVTPPTPQPLAQQEGKVPDQPAPSLPEDESLMSPTASIPESMEILSQPGDGDAPVSSGASALKRASSGEVTRMRGPRGRSSWFSQLL